DPGALADPLVARVHETRHVLVGDDPFGHEVPETQYARVDRFAHRPPQSRITAAAHDRPAPKAAQQTRSPGPTRPAAIASARAIGMPAAATWPAASAVATIRSPGTPRPASSARRATRWSRSWATKSATA